MASEIQNTIAAGSPAITSRIASPAAALQTKAAVVDAPAQPKVTAPKPIDIKFDAAEVRQTLQEAVSFLNKQLNEHNRGIGFSIDDSLETPVVTVRSTTTGEVVRQIPNEAAVRMAHNIESIKGMLINANV
jgi:flagellar protein FlaG